MCRAAAEANVVFWVAGPTGSACKFVSVIGKAGGMDGEKGEAGKHRGGGRERRRLAVEVDVVVWVPQVQPANL